VCARKTQSLHLYYVFITPPGKWEKIQLKLKTKRYAYLAELSLVQLWQSLPVWFFCWFIHNMSGPFSAWFFSRLLVSRFLLPAVSCPQTENTRSTYASDAGPDSTSLGKWSQPSVFISIPWPRTEVHCVLSSSCTRQNKQSVQCPQCWCLLPTAFKDSSVRTTASAP